MKTTADINGNMTGVPNIRPPRQFRLSLLELFILSILLISGESARTQGCLAILKISDPAPVCFSATVDLTSVAITAGSTEGLIFSYYTDPELSVPITNPSKVSAGTFYIKGLLTDPRTAWVAGSVKVTVLEKPNLKVISSILVSVNEKTDLTSPLITMGSDTELTFSYWSDSVATMPLPSPKLAGKGSYFIKGTSSFGCFDIKPITVTE